MKAKEPKELKGSGPANIPQSKRTKIKLSHPEATSALSRYHNIDTISATPEGGVKE